MKTRLSYKTGLLLGSAIVLTIVIVSVLSQSAESASQKRSVLPNIGEYLRTDYVKSLKMTLSPYRSHIFGTAQLVTVQRDNVGILLQTVLNFHEGGPTFVLDDNGFASVQTSAGFDTSNVEIEVLDSQRVKLGFGKFRTESYVFVGDASRYVAAQVLVGEYVDREGQRYVFGADGWGRFPNRMFEYQVGLDHVMNRFDYFDDKTSNKVYAFKRSKEALEIFSTSGEVNQQADKQPMLSLKRSASRK